MRNNNNLSIKKDKPIIKTIKSTNLHQNHFRHQENEITQNNLIGRDQERKIKKINKKRIKRIKIKNTKNKNTDLSHLNPGHYRGKDNKEKIKIKRNIMNIKKNMSKISM